MGLKYISKVTAVGGNTSSLVFSNIPQNYNSLYLVISSRQADTNNCYFYPNGNSADLYSRRLVGGGASSGTTNTYTNNDGLTGDNQYSSNTANMFGSMSILVPDYTSSNQKKKYLIDFVTVNESSTSWYNNYSSGVWYNNSPITSITIGTPGTGFAQHTSAYLYGLD